MSVSAEEALALANAAADYDRKKIYSRAVWYYRQAIMAYEDHIADLHQRRAKYKERDEPEYAAFVVKVDALLERIEYLYEGYKARKTKLCLFLDKQEKHTLIDLDHCYDEAPM